MIRLVLICGEAIVLDEAPEDGRPDVVAVGARAAAGLTRLNATRVPVVLVETADVPDAALRARRRDALRAGLARHGARLDDIAGPARSAPAVAEAVGLALRRFAAAPGATWVLAETLPALEAAAETGCRRALLRTRAGRAAQAQGVPERLLPVAVHADLAAAVPAILGEAD